MVEAPPWKKPHLAAHGMFRGMMEKLDMKNAFKYYEKAGTHKKDVPRMLL